LVGLLRHDEITVDDIEQESAARFQRLVHVARNLEVSLFLKVTKTGVPAVDAVEHIFELHLAHVALQEVDLLTVFLGKFRSFCQLRHTEVETDDLVPARCERHGMLSSAAGEIEHHSLFGDTQRVFDEVSFFLELLFGERRDGSGEIGRELDLTPKAGTRS
jgi:hypothetical protein